jgi:putative FmdB family regulatory protein
MPNWDFKCPLCEGVTEHFIENNEAVFPVCETCKVTLTKLFSATPAHFKGGGWAGKG